LYAGFKYLKSLQFYFYYLAMAGLTWRVDMAGSKPTRHDPFQPISVLHFTVYIEVSWLKSNMATMASGEFSFSSYVSGDFSVFSTALGNSLKLAIVAIVAITRHHYFSLLFILYIKNKRIEYIVIK